MNLTALPLDTAPAKDPTLDDAEALAGVTKGDEPDENVLAMLGVPRGKRARATRCTLLTIFGHDPRWAGRLRLDLFRDQLLVDDAPVTDIELTRIACWVEEVYGANPSKELVYECLTLVASEHGFHPILEWAARLAWDGVERLPTMLQVYFGAPDDEVTREMSRAWLVGGAARVMEPGCKLDTVLVLVGAQGIGKSTALKTLMADASWFADTPLDLRSKDAMQNIGGVWLTELPEMEGLRGRGCERIKAFLSSSVDTYRAPYARIPGRHPRQCFFAATTNEPEFLADWTGARRFWPVPVTRIDVAALRRDRDQLWAEAFARHARGETWHLPHRLEKAHRAATETYEHSDPLAERLAVWVAGIGRAFTTEEAVALGLGLAPEKMDRALSMRLGSMLARLGCSKFRARRAEAGRKYLWEPAQPRPEK